MKWPAMLLILVLIIPLNAIANNYGGDGGPAIANSLPNVHPLNITGNDTVTVWTTAFDANREYDFCGARLNIHSNTSINSPVIRYYVWTPSGTNNLTVTNGAIENDGEIYIEKSIPGQHVCGADRLYVVKVYDDNFTSEYISTKIYRNYPLPFFYNLNGYGSYIHRSDNNPTPTQAVDFFVWVEDYDTPETSLVVRCHYSIDNKNTWNLVVMVYDPVMDYWGCQRGGYPAQTTMWYYVTADDSNHTTRTPNPGYEYLIWDNPPSSSGEPTFTTTYILKKGWNLCGTDTELILNAKQIVSYQGIEAIGIRTKSGIYESCNYEGYGSDFKVEAYTGFFIFATLDLELKLKGCRTGTTFNLYDGYTLIGGVTHDSALEFLNITGSRSITGRRDNGDWETARYDMHIDFNLLETRGYYVYRENSRTINWS